MLISQDRPSMLAHSDDTRIEQRVFFWSELLVMSLGRIARWFCPKGSNLVRISLTCCRCLPLRLPMIIRRFLVACAVTSQALWQSICRMSSCARLCTGVLETRNVCVFVTKGYKFKDIFGDFVFERFQKLLMKYHCWENMKRGSKALESVLLGACFQNVTMAFTSCSSERSSNGGHFGEECSISHSTTVEMRYLLFSKSSIIVLSIFN